MWQRLRERVTTHVRSVIDATYRHARKSETWNANVSLKVCESLRRITEWRFQFPLEINHVSALIAHILRASSSNGTLIIQTQRCLVPDVVGWTAKTVRIKLKRSGPRGEDRETRVSPKRTRWTNNIRFGGWSRVHSVWTCRSCLYKPSVRDGWVSLLVVLPFFMHYFAAFAPHLYKL